MKKCPSCGKTYDDVLRFCQTDGSPLIEAPAEASRTEAVAPETPQDFDPLKTMVAASHPTVSAEKLAESESDAPGSPSPEESGGSETLVAPPPSPMSPPTLPSIPSPFSKPNAPPLPSGKSDQSVGSQSAQPDWKASSDPAPSSEEPATVLAPPPFGAFASPTSAQPREATGSWAPPPAPVAAWQGQGIGSQTPFQPPAGEGADSTLAIVSLVCGIAGIFCCPVIPSVAAIITGVMARSRANADPARFGGHGMATAGVVTGIAGIVLTLLGVLLFLVAGLMG